MATPTCAVGSRFLPGGEGGFHQGGSSLLFRSRLQLWVSLASAALARVSDGVACRAGTWTAGAPSLAGGQPWLGT